MSRVKKITAVRFTLHTCFSRDTNHSVGPLWVKSSQMYRVTEAKIELGELQEGGCFKGSGLRMVCETLKRKCTCSEIGLKNVNKEYDFQIPGGLDIQLQERGHYFKEMVLTRKTQLRLESLCKSLATRHKDHVNLPKELSVDWMIRVLDACGDSLVKDE